MLNGVIYATLVSTVCNLMVKFSTPPYEGKKKKKKENTQSLT